MFVTTQCFNNLPQDPAVSYMLGSLYICTLHLHLSYFCIGGYCQRAVPTALIYYGSNNNVWDISKKNSVQSKTSVLNLYFLANIFWQNNVMISCPFIAIFCLNSYVYDIPYRTDFPAWWIMIAGAEEPAWPVWRNDEERRVRHHRHLRHRLHCLHHWYGGISVIIIISDVLAFCFENFYSIFAPLLDR